MVIPNFSDIIKFCIFQVKANVNVDSPLRIKYTIGNQFRFKVDVKTIFVYSDIHSIQLRRTCMLEDGLRKRRK